MRTGRPYQLLLLTASLLNCANILYCQANETGQLPAHFLPFGALREDLTVPNLDDGSTEAIQLSSGIRFFSTTYNQIYVNTNGLLSFGDRYTATTSSGSFDFHQIPLIAPFWDDVNVVINGTIFYREDFDPMIADRLRREISAEYPEAGTFNASVVFVATWDQVAPFSSQFRGLRNTFQVVIASDGSMTFVIFNYGDIQWGGVNTLIGVSAGDGINSVVHPASFTTQVLLLDNTTVSYRVDVFPGTPVTPTSSEGPTDTTVPPTTPGFCEDFEIRSTTQSTSVTVGGLTNLGNIFVIEGNIEVCIGGFFSSICDVGWDDVDAQLVCNYLGYESRLYVGSAVRGLSSDRFNIAENVSCPSNVTHPSQCSYTSPIVTPRCFGPSSAAGFRCTQVRVPCFSEGEIAVISPTYENYLNIFTGGPLSFSGKVGVCRDGVYDSICDVSWDENDARVLCQNLGARGSAPLRGLGVGLDPISLEEVNCDGSESSIQDCPTSPIGELSPTCLEPNRAAGVTCSIPEGDCVDSAGVRLADGPNFYEGRFEVCRNNSWLSVCDVGVDSSLALIACEARGHFGDDVIPVFGSGYGSGDDIIPVFEGGYGPGTGPQLVVCTESPFLDLILVEECTSNPELEDLCSHERDAGVRCQPGLLSMFNTTSGFPVLGLSFSPFTLECFANQNPWEAKLVADGWSRFGVPVQFGDSVSYTLLQDSYNPSVFNLTYTYRSQLTFDGPLRLSDRGEYSCDVAVELRYPDNSTYLLTNSTSYSVVIQVPPPSVSVEINGSQVVNTRLDVHCFAELLDPFLADYIMIDFFDGAFQNISAILEHVPPEVARLQLSPIRQYNETHVVRTITAMPLLEEDQDNYFCNVDYNLNDSYIVTFSTSHAFTLRVFSNDTGEVPARFLPFGALIGDSIAPPVDDGSTGAIQLSAGIRFFGTTYNEIYVNTNGILSFNVSVTSPATSFFLHPFPIIAPFWDDVNVAINGTIFYREDFDPMIADRLRREISAEYPEAGTFHPSVVFVATWDRVEPFQSTSRGLRNTFQVVIASDGSMTFVIFNYGDIQWGGVATLIGYNAGDGVNSVIHPASYSTQVLLLDNTTISYRVDGGVPSLPPPIGVQGLCSVVVWSSPDIPCNNISSYDVRLYHSQLPDLNLTRQVPPNGTYYIIRDGDQLTGVPSSEVYVQVRVVHTSGGIGDWSEGISLGCEEPTDPVIPRVYFEHKGEVYANNSVIPLSEIREGEVDALYCRTDNEACCRPNRIGEFYYPNGVKVPISRFRHGFYRNRGNQAVLLNRRAGVQSPRGRYRCEIPNADGVLENIYITIA